MSKAGIIESDNEEQQLPFFGNPFGNLYFGLELELAVPNSVAKCDGCKACKGVYRPYHYFGEEDSEWVNGSFCKKTQSAWKVYAKKILGKDWAVVGSDGSIGFGIEIRTAPSSIAVHRNRWKKFFRPKVLSNYQATTKCGIHIHASKDFLLYTEHKGKLDTTTRDSKRLADARKRLINLIYNKKHYNFLTELFGRKESRYNKYGIRHEIRDYWDHGTDYLHTSIAISRGPDIGHKYGALHETSHTMEFRVFPSTTDYDTLIANLETVRAIMSFGREPNEGTLEEFKIFLQERLTKAPFLHKRLENLGLINEDGEFPREKLKRKAATASGKIDF